MCLVEFKKKQKEPIISFKGHFNYEIFQINNLNLVMALLTIVACLISRPFSYLIACKLANIINNPKTTMDET